MKMANLSEVKDQLSAYVDLARNGQSVRIMVRGVPAADLVPIPPPEGEAWLAERERRGIVRRGAVPLDPLLLEIGPAVEGAPSDELVSERRER